MSWCFNGEIHHFKLFYDGRYYVKDKRYETMHELIADGLVTRYIQSHAAHITELMHEKAAYQESPYVTLNRRKLRALSNKNKTMNASIEDLTNKNLTFVESCDFPQNTNARPPTMSTSDSVINNDTISNILIGKYTKEHSFKVHTFKGLNWCEFCANFLWGFTAQGMKCEDCGFIAHTKCSKLVPSHCMPDLKKLRGVFGIDLTTLLNAHSSTLPFVVKKCVKEIEARGMEQEGIYRISGFADEIEALKMALDRDGEAANLSEYSNINVIAGCLKLYLRLLPIPLLTDQLHQKLIDASYLKTLSDQISSFREILTDLPPAHYNTLQYMIQHLHRVSLQAHVNKMNAHNLCTVFVPTLMAIPPQSTDLTQEIHVLEIFVTNSAKIFGTS
ncbi:beta-chimaerin-like isoform X2 [Arctopsyche grandis]